MLTVGSLFTGVAGIDLGFEHAGFRVAWQIEKDRQCRKLLSRYFPDATQHEDVTTVDANQLERVDVLAGGDPCPHRSRGNAIHGSDAPDLYPDYLRIVSALRPLWVLREHVVAGDTDRCWSDLCRLGYNAIVLDCDSAEITGQSRPREYLCGVLESSGICPGEVFSQRESRAWDHPSSRKAGPIAQCLTTNDQRFDACDNYVLEPGRGMRILCSEERERLQGFMPGWTGGFPAGTRARMTGNAATVPLVAWIAGRIAAATI